MRGHRYVVIFERSAALSPRALVVELNESIGHHVDVSPSAGSERIRDRICGSRAL